MRFPVLLIVTTAVFLTACTTTPVEQQPAEAAPAVKTWGDVRDSLTAGLRSNPHLSVQPLNDGDLYVQIRSGDSFAVGSAEPSPILLQVLDHVADVLRQNGVFSVQVLGHTDNVGSQQTNLKLSSERAMAVMQYLIVRGVDKNYISAEGRGAEEPIASNTTREGRNVNRRIELLIRPLSSQ